MILLTVGTQFPFDRMVRVVDDWADEEGREDVMAQIGPSSYQPKRLRCFSFTSPAELRAMQERSAVILAHAGMGSIVTALELGKPIIVMPRDHERGEHRNGHQMATARRFQSIPGVHVAADEADLADRLRRLDTLTASGPAVSSVAPAGFLDALRAHLAKTFAG